MRAEKTCEECSSSVTIVWSGWSLRGWVWALGELRRWKRDHIPRFVEHGRQEEIVERRPKDPR